MGFAAPSGAEIKLDMLSPGSRIGGFFNYGVGATRYVAGNLASPASTAAATRSPSVR